MASGAIDAFGSRGTLIGRRLELSWLRTRYAHAVAGAPQVVLLEGEVGIGKTRLASELLDAARRDGVRVIRGRCYEHLDLAYLPFREALFPALAEWPGAVRYAGELDVVRQLTDESSGAPPVAAAVDGHARQVLAVTRLVIEYARVQPTVLFVDDLHWADAPTVDVIRHLLFRFDDEAAPLLVLATARTDTGARAAESIEKIRTEWRSASLTLHPLPALEATELARELGQGRELEAARRIARAAGGNPLLVEALTRPMPRSPTAAPTVTSPHPITAAVEERFASLGADARRVAQVAAFLAPAARVGMLRAVAVEDPTALSDAIDEAVGAGVLADDGDQLTFTHPLYAHVAYEATPPSRRRAIHADIASAMLAQEPLDLRRVAFHLVGAADAADPRHVADIGRRAADQAFAAAAWGDAATFYEAAARVLPEPADVTTRAELHRLAGLSRRGNLQLRHAVEHFEAAIDALGPDGDPRSLADLHTWRIRCGIGSHDLVDRVRDTGPLEALLPDLEHDDPGLAAEAWVELAQAYWIAWDLARSEDAAHRAMELATAAANHEAYGRAAMALSVPQWARYDIEESLATLRDGAARETFDDRDAERAGGPRFRIPIVLAWLGRLDDAVATADECSALAERVDYPLEIGLPLAALALTDVVRGDYDGAEQHAHRALVVQRLSGYHWAEGLFVPAWFAGCVARGEFDAAEELLADWEPHAGQFERATITFLRRYGGALQRELPVRGVPLPNVPRVAAVGVEAWAAMAVEIARRETVDIDPRRLHDALADAQRRGGVVASGVGMLIERVRGVAADLMGDEKGALAALDGAVHTARSIGAEPELARALADAAIIRLRRDERRDALDLLDEARERFDRLGMRPDLARAERLAGGPRRGAARSTPGPSPAGETTHAVLLFTDVVDSTRLTEELGSARYRERARDIEAVVTSAITAAQGTVVTGINLGDGFIGLFDSVARALDAARRCARDAGSTGLHLHVAVHAGEILVDGPRIHGGPVNYAARVSDLTGPDEILVSQVVRDAAAPLADVAFVDRGEHVLKGIAGSQHLYAVVDALADPGGRA